MGLFRRNKQEEVEEVVEEQVNFNKHENITASEYYDTVVDLSDQVREQFKSLVRMEGDSTHSLDQLFQSNQETVSKLHDASRAAQGLNESNETLEVEINAVSQEMGKADKAIDESGSHFGDMQQNVSDMNKVVTEITDRMSKLRSEFDNISSKVQNIDEIAESTTILALNSSIEANRAGEAGRGFAVVASETSELAQSTRGFSREILSSMDDLRGVVLQLQKQVDSISEIIGQTTETVNSVAQGFDTVRDSGSQVTSHLNNVLNLQDQNGELITEFAQSLAGVENRAQADNHKLDILIKGVQNRSNNYKNIANDLEQMNLLAKKAKQQ
jgi:methyl-accepting chemotaxis protein